MNDESWRACITVCGLILLCISMPSTPIHGNVVQLPGWTKAEITYGSVVMNTDQVMEFDGSFVMFYGNLSHGDYALQFDAKIDSGNSILVGTRVTKNFPGSSPGFRLDIKRDVCEIDFRWMSGGRLYRWIREPKRYKHNASKWTRYLITVRGKKISVSINGRRRFGEDDTKVHHGLMCLGAEGATGQIRNLQIRAIGLEGAGASREAPSPQSVADRTPFAPPQGWTNFQLRDGAIWTDDHDVTYMENAEFRMFYGSPTATDYVLRFSAKIDRGQALVIGVRVNRQFPSSSSPGYKIMIRQNQMELELQRTTAKRDEFPDPKRIRHKGDRWNQYLIRARGNKITVSVNGRVLLREDDNYHLSGLMCIGCENLYAQMKNLQIAGR